MREKQGTIGARTSAREFSQRVFGTDSELSSPEVPDLEFNNTVELAELLGNTTKVPLRHCPAASGCEESLVRVNIGLDVRPGM
jgi:hypothetical protein